MGQARQGAVCKCGASHPRRPEAARDGWVTLGTMQKRRWVCPECWPALARERDRQARKEYEQHEARQAERRLHIGPRPRSGMSLRLMSAVLGAFSVPDLPVIRNDLRHRAGPIDRARRS